MFGREIQVNQVSRISPKLVEVVGTSPDLGSLRWKPGDKIKVDVGGGMRSYTPSDVNVERGTLSLVAVVHGNGAGSRWADRVEAGDHFRFVGPKRSLTMPPAPPSWAAFFGDETTVGAAKALLDALPAGTPVFGALEVDTNDKVGVAQWCPRVPVVARQWKPREERSEAGKRFAPEVEHERGQALLDVLAETQFPDEDGLIWLSGEATSLLALRRALLNRGLSRSHLCIKPYWSVRGKAHRKQLERGELRS